MAKPKRGLLNEKKYEDVGGSVNKSGKQTRLYIMLHLFCDLF